MTRQASVPDRRRRRLSAAGAAALLGALGPLAPAHAAAVPITYSTPKVGALDYNLTDLGTAHADLLARFPFVIFGFTRGNAQTVARAPYGRTGSLYAQTR